MPNPRIPPKTRRALSRASLATAGVLLGELAYAVLRPAPEQPEFDASGRMGTGLPLAVGVIGDSSCTGPGLSGPEEIWVQQTGILLAKRGFDVRLNSVAVGGARVADALDDQLPLLLETDPDVVLVAVGSNDVLKGTTPNAFERDLMSLAVALSATRSLVVLSGIGDLGSIPRLLPPLRQVIRARARQFDAIHGRVAERFDFLKADQWTTAAAILADPSAFTADLFHPGPRGHAAWADVAMDVLEPHLDRFTDG